MLAGLQHKESRQGSEVRTQVAAGSAHTPKRTFPLNMEFATFSSSSLIST
jgi:hypothetical protein